MQADSAEARYRLLANDSRDVISCTSVQGLITWISPAVDRVLGYDPEALVGTPAVTLVHPEDREAAHSAFARACDVPDHGATVSLRLRRRGGDYVAVEVVLHALRGADGVVTELQSSARDLSGDVAAEATSRTAEDVFRLALEHAPMGMAVLDLDGRWVTVNAALGRITGRSAVQIEQARLVDLVHADDLGQLSSTWSMIREGDSDSGEHEIRLLTVGGDAVWVELSLTAVRQPGEEPRYVVVQIVDISRRKQAQERLARRAVTDPLTGLPNRRVLHDRLEHALVRCRRESRQVGLVFLDIDHFKNLNDGYGHDAGDEVLCQLAKRLSRAVRDGDTAVRLGGDEFVVLCEEDVELSHMQALAQRLLVELGRPYALSWGEAKISCSFGLTVGNGPDATTLMHEADTAMYRSKQQGRSLVNVYDRAIQADALHDLALEDELERALAEGELRVHYQPIVRLADGVVHAREALIRWQHPTRGLLNPAAFMPVAEQSRLITEMGRWMLDRACRDAAGWEDGAVVGVNISPRHLAQADFPASVAEVLTASGLSPQRLQIEITESSILQASTSTLTSTAGLTDLGVTLALDDFGTGYSSITALHRLPITTLKIDRSFVQGLPGDDEACALVNGLLKMAVGLGLDVIGEGVETAEQEQWLLAHGCPLVQGYRFGRPEQSG